MNNLQGEGKIVYPLVTHDPNMLKKVMGELIWKIKVSLPEGKYENFG